MAGQWDTRRGTFCIEKQDIDAATIGQFNELFGTPTGKTVKKDGKKKTILIYKHHYFQENDDFDKLISMNRQLLFNIFNVEDYR